MYLKASSFVLMIPVTWLSLGFVNQSEVGLQTHIVNILAIFISLLMLQLARWWLESNEDEFAGRAPIKNGIFDLMGNVGIFVLCYTSTFKLSPIHIAAGAILASASVVRILKYRIYDDLYRHRIYRKGSRKYSSPQGPGHALLRFLLDHLLRSYLYTAFSFTIFQLLLMMNSLYGTNMVVSDSFLVSNPSGNPFMDFVYFNIVTLATVGYGDIRPVSATAKLTCSIEILFAFLVLTTLFTSLMSRFQNIAAQDTSVN
jgi:hypothetical protein